MITNGLEIKRDGVDDISRTSSTIRTVELQVKSRNMESSNGIEIINIHIWYVALINVHK